ncbi:MAG: hypothetical protein ACW960_15465, partial [Candidatus Thorarchaeota archaeon]
MEALSTSKLNQESVNLGPTARVENPVTTRVEEIDALLATYWRGQTALAETVKSFFENQDYSNLATGLY